MWSYSQATGTFKSPGGTSVGIGYSGHAQGLNNPALQQVHMVGPIPQGDWEIGQFFDDVGGKGPVVARLTPLPGTETFGRDGFMIHGDNSQVNHSASEGCVILPHVVREMVMSSHDRLLTVTA